MTWKLFACATNSWKAANNNVFKTYFIDDCNLSLPYTNTFELFLRNSACIFSLHYNNNFFINNNNYYYASAQWVIMHASVGISVDQWHRWDVCIVCIISSKRAQTPAAAGLLHEGRRTLNAADRWCGLSDGV